MGERPRRGRKPISPFAQVGEAFLEFLSERGMTLEEFEALNPCTQDVIKMHYEMWAEGRRRRGKGSRSPR